MTKAIAAAALALALAGCVSDAASPHEAPQTGFTSFRKRPGAVWVARTDGSSSCDPIGC
jgi:hypothetical protein